MDTNDRGSLSAWLRLSLVPGIGNIGARKLLARFGLPEEVFGQTENALGQVVGDTHAAALLAEPPDLPALLETTWRWLQEGAAGATNESGGRAVLTLGDSSYPAALLNIEDPPLLLYLLGASVHGGQLDDAVREPLAHSLAIVGSRNPTPRGAQHARQFARACGEAGLAVVSGLALGVDGAAHEGALEAAAPAQRLATVAVVGTGLDRVYPRQHRDLSHRIARQGLLVSEYALGTPALAPNFPRRNRLIAGLSQATLVVEAALKSGSLITARMASEQGKDVFALPGSIDSPQSRGCHALIQQGAKLVESAEDIFEELRLPAAAPHDPSATARAPAAPEDALLQALGFDPASFDALQARTGLPTAALQARLLELELEGSIARLPGGRFQRIGSA